MSEETILDPMVDDSCWTDDDLWEEDHLMTVGELREALESYDDDMKVMVMIGDTGYSVGYEVMADLDSKRSILHFGQSPNADETVLVLYTNDDDQYDI